MRCRCCNRLLTELEEKRIQRNGQPEDLCVRCCTKADDDIQIADLGWDDIFADPQRVEDLIDE